MEISKIKYSSDQLFCGMDGGGTTSKVLVCNLKGEIVYSFKTGSINHYGAGINRAKSTFQEIANKLNATFGCLPGIIFIGNSALDGIADETLVNWLTEGVFYPSKVIFHSDVYVALLGFTLGKPGAMLISGTGSMACGIDAEGKYYTAGGWGQVLGDEGSGYHIALEGIKAALHAFDGVGEPTRLTELVMQFFKLTTMPELIDKIYNPPVEKSLIAAFATGVEKTAYSGDTVALEILKSEARWLYKLALAITGKCNTKNLGFNGSVLQQNKTIVAELTNLLAVHNITLQAPLFSPEIGALIGAFGEAGITLTPAITDNLLKYR